MQKSVIQKEAAKPNAEFDWKFSEYPNLSRNFLLGFLPIHRYHVQIKETVGLLPDIY